MFEHVGSIEYKAGAATAEAMFEAALDAGATDVESDETTHQITCATDDLSAVRDALEARFGAPDAARLDWRPLTTVPIDEQAASTLLKLIDVLDDNDDVQRVATNFEVDDAVMERLSA